MYRDKQIPDALSLSGIKSDGCGVFNLFGDSAGISRALSNDLFVFLHQNQGAFTYCANG